jgi:CRP-like cAMP-binding protein
VKISIPSVDGHEAVFNRMSDGDIFGEIALLDGRPCTADAVAITERSTTFVAPRRFGSKKLPLAQFP